MKAGKRVTSNESKEMVSSFGLCDSPIELEADESLGLRDYAASLIEFVRRCETPMTIALQGDWGSGKTSLMNLIRSDIKPDEKILDVWFNTWQYSQFTLSDTLAISLISHFIDQVSVPEQTTVAKSTIQTLSKVARFGAVFAASYVTGDSNSAREAMNAVGSEGYTDPAHEIRKLKDALIDIVTSRTDLERVVIFIDDIDRLVPVKAVELLESLKLFLDIPKCVFVLACDYQVVIQGLRQKFGVTEAELKGKSFFDKIIQVPFNMPLTQYQVDSYIGDLLNRIGVSYRQEQLAEYNDLISFSAGFNPRTMKRLFNSLLLLKLVANRKDVLAEVREHADESEIDRMLFALLCLQYSYESAYRYIACASNINQEWFDIVRDGEKLSADTECEPIRVDLGLAGKDAPAIRKFSGFMEAFYSSIQLRSDEEDSDNELLSSDEIKTLKRLLTFSSMISTDSNEIEIDPGERQFIKEMAKVLMRDIRKAHKDVFANNKKNIEMWPWQPRDSASSDLEIYIQFSDPDIGIGMGFTRASIYSYLFTHYTRGGNLERAQKWAEANIKKHIDEYKIPDEVSKDCFAYLHEEVVEPSLPWEARSKKFTDMCIKMVGRFFPAVLEGNWPEA